MAKLVLHQGSTSTEFSLDRVVTIGRQSGNAIHLDQEVKASRNHARVLMKDNDFVVEDLDSSNGTKINGKKISGLKAIYHGDTIMIGATRIVFDEPSRKKPAKPASTKDEADEIGLTTSLRREDTQAPLCGKTVGGYQVVARIGQGGMGSVYRSRQLSMDREVALKVLNQDLAQNKDFIKSFLQEARLAGQLTHPALVQIHDVGEADGILYYSMELIDGETVNDILKREGKLNVARTLDIAIGVSEALSAAQRHKIVHQDIKPHNIMVDRRGNVKLADLGLATLAGQPRPADKRPDVLMGTPLYMAPEQSKKGRIDTRTDIYALGTTLFHMLTGRVPFEGPNSLVVLTKHMTQERPDPRQYDVTIPGALAELIMNMMAIDMTMRPGDPKELAERFKRLKEAYLREVERVGKKKTKGGVVSKYAVLSDGPAMAFSKVEEMEVPVAQQVRTEIAAHESQPTELAKLGLYAAGFLVLLVVAWFAFKTILRAVNGEPTVHASPKPPDVAHKSASPNPLQKTTVRVVDKTRDVQSTPENQNIPADSAGFAALDRAIKARDRALETRNFTGARQALQGFLRQFRVGPAAERCTQEQRETEKVIGDVLARMFGDAEKAAADKNYRSAVVECTRLISADPQGPLAPKAGDLLARMDEDGRAIYDQALAQADKQLTANKIAEAMRVLGTALTTLGGTKWGEPLTTRQIQFIYANKFLDNLERGRKKRADTGKPTDVAVQDQTGRKTQGVLREIKGLAFDVELGGVGFPSAFSKLAPDDIYQLATTLEQHNDHLGLANLFALLKHDKVALKELERALQAGDPSGEAARLTAKMSGASGVRSYDFSKWQHQGDWDAPSGAWATQDDRYVLESPEGGDTTLKTSALGGPFVAKNARIGFEFVLDAAKANKGWYLALEFGDERRNLTVLFSDEGYRVQDSGGEQVKGEWKPEASCKVELEFQGDAASVVINGKKGETLNAAGLSNIKGTLTFHIRETTAALDNITLRTVEK